LGVFDEHDGLQNMPVVRTPKKNKPSNCGFFASTARHRQSIFVNRSPIMIQSLLPLRPAFYPKSVVQFFCEMTKHMKHVKQLKRVKQAKH
jgi:hypothetical protein